MNIISLVTRTIFGLCVYVCVCVSAGEFLFQTIKLKLVNRKFRLVPKNGGAICWRVLWGDGHSLYLLLDRQILFWWIYTIFTSFGACAQGKYARLNSQLFIVHPYSFLTATSCTTHFNAVVFLFYFNLTLVYLFSFFLVVLCFSSLSVSYRLSTVYDVRPMRLKGSTLPHKVYC